MTCLPLKTFVLQLLFFVYCFGLFAQDTNNLWTKTTQQKAERGKLLKRKSQPHKSDFYQLDINALKSKLKNAPVRGKNLKRSKMLIDFPLANGTFETFQIIERPILHPDLQATMPNSRTYKGQSITNPTNTIIFSITSHGLNTMLLTANHNVEFIDPISYGGNNYMVYRKSDLPALKEQFVCEFKDQNRLMEKTAHTNKLQRNANDGVLRTYRLAVASTIEYSEFHWRRAGLTDTDTEADKKNAVMNAMIVTMNRVNGVFENELSLTMQFVANNKDIIFIDSDSFSNNDTDALIEQSQIVIDATIGNQNYDIGHTFSTGAGGLAVIYSPCDSDFKAMGVTGTQSPVGDSYDIDFVSHEMGHQFGAPHTFNGNTGNCIDNREPSNAYEPGSGSTIMAYAGICDPQNVQIRADAYFHQKSLQEMWNYISIGGGSCATQTNTNNSAPTAEAGSNYTIPISTPYKLTGSSTDADGTDSHTYTWEQYDLGPSGMPSETSSSGPLVRSYMGTSNPTRYIPNLTDLAISNGSTNWEKLASINRNINFQLTVRDNDIRGGQTATDNMRVTTNPAAGPFLVNSQNTSGISWIQGSTETITWDVAGTTTNGVNTAAVNILLSTDGGLHYDTVLASNVPNDGLQNVTVPNVLAPFCRVMVEAVNNIFFAINNADFAIGYTVTESCTEYTSTDPNLPITIDDNGNDYTNTSVVNVPANTTISNIKLTVNITHPFPGDVLLGLQSPSSTLNNILESYSPCQNEDSDIIVTFDDAGVPFNCNTTGDNISMKSPISSLRSWNGENALGNWVLALGDFGPQDIGILHSWSISVCSFEFTLLDIKSNGLQSLEVYPNPNFGEFTIALKNSASEKVEVGLFDIRGRSIYKKAFNNPNSDFIEKIQLKTIQSGVYLLKVNDGFKKYTKKIVVE